MKILQKNKYKHLYHFLNHQELNTEQIAAYHLAVSTAFPPIIQASQVSKSCWGRLEKYFPQFQQFLIKDDGELIGFINAIPFHWDKALDNLPDDGWDWMLTKGIIDYENKVSPTHLGGLQIIVRKKFQGQGFSKKIIHHAREIVSTSDFQNLVIPIRPTVKHMHPQIPMVEYIQKKENDQIYDPWIRTHLNGGASVIKVCSNAMNIQGSLSFWEQLMGRKITSSGSYLVPGALNPVQINILKAHGEYREENIWICYDKSH